MEKRVGNLLSLDGKTAIVTGAATGIGEGIAHLLAEAGAQVAIFDIDGDGAALVAGAIEGAGGAASAKTVDVTDIESVEVGVESVLETTGRIDVLVNNAGSYRSSGTINNMSMEDWEKIRAVNLDSLFVCCKVVSHHMIERGGGGTIVNITSVDGIHPFLGVNYDSAKAGANFFTKTLALDLSPHGIRVNAVAPGLVPVETLARIQSGDLPPISTPPSKATGLSGPTAGARAQNIPLGRPGTPDEIGRAVLFFSTEASSYVTGQTLAVEGGWLLV